MGKMAIGEQTHAHMPSDNASASHHFGLVPYLSHTLPQLQHTPATHVGKNWFDMAEPKDILE
jgi:hypothetical protein